MPSLLRARRASWKVHHSTFAMWAATRWQHGCEEAREKVPVAGSALADATHASGALRIECVENACLGERRWSRARHGARPFIGRRQLPRSFATAAGAHDARRAKSVAAGRR